MNQISLADLWGNLATVLGDPAVMSAPLTYPCYHEEKQPTWHDMLRRPGPGS